MGGFSDSVENDVLDHMLGNAAWTYSPTQRVIALHTGDPGEDGLSNEVSGGSYSRQNADFSSASLGLSSNIDTVTFSDMPASIITHASIWYSTTFLCCGALLSQISLDSGQEIYFNPGDIEVGAD